MVLLSLALACAVHRVGYLEVTPDLRLVSTEAGRERLLLVGEAQRLSGLEGHLVEVTGTRTVRRIAVSSFRPLEGPHGLPAWYGPLQQLGSQVAIADLASGGLVFLDPRTAEILWGNSGRYVAAEGYIDGPQRLAVLYWRFVGD